MRIRSVKPDFFKDDELAALPPLARLLFVGLWCLADCEGRLKDRPSRIRAEVLPYDECDVDGLLSALHTAEFIVRYDVPPMSYIEVRSFKKHQRISGIEAGKQSEIPAPDHPEAVEKQSRSTGEAPEKESRSSHCPGREGKGREGKGTRHSANDVRALFLDRFWPFYPRKVNKGTAEKAWLRLADEERADALTAVEVYAHAWLHAPEDRQSFIPHPASWLSGKRWLDDPEDWKRQAKGTTVAPARPAPTLIGSHPPGPKLREIDEDSPEEIVEIVGKLRRREATDAEIATLDAWQRGSDAH